MNGLDDYKNILSGGIRIVQTGVVPVYAADDTTTPDGMPTITLNVGGMFVTEVVDFDVSTGGYCVGFSENYTVLVHTYIDWDGTYRRDSNDSVSYHTGHRECPCYYNSGSMIRLKGFFSVLNTVRADIYSKYRWLVLRIA